MNLEDLISATLRIETDPFTEKQFELMESLISSSSSKESPKFASNSMEIEQEASTNDAKNPNFGLDSSSPKTTSNATAKQASSRASMDIDPEDKTSGDVSSSVHSSASKIDPEPILDLTKLSADEPMAAAALAGYALFQNHEAMLKKSSVQRNINITVNDTIHQNQMKGKQRTVKEVSEQPIKAENFNFSSRVMFMNADDQPTLDKNAQRK